MKKLLSFIWVILLTPCLVFSQEKNNGKNSSKENKADSVILKDDNPRISAMDSLLKLKVFKKDSFITDTSKLNVYNYPADSIPTFEDSVYKKRVHELNKKSPIELQYNDKVKAFIKLYANKKRNLTSRFLGLSEVYFPMIEEKLDKFGIPLEMKYLAIVESALNPTAHSRAGAKGLWQFMYRTGKLYDLNVTSYVDERMSHEKATIAACKYLKFLHGIYDDWNLVMAAYNAGPGRVNRAMRRAGGKMGYWELRPHLPRETRGYVPAFIAVNYIMNYSAEHNLYPIQPDMRYFEFDTIHVKEPVTFKGLHELMNIPYKTLEFLNPKYKRGKIPEGNKILRLPKDQIGTFLANEDSIYEYEPKPDIVNGFIVKQKAEYHRVRSGENLGVIANKYNCSVRQIMQWNNKRSTRIHPGQRIKIQRTVKIPVDDKEKVADKRNTDSLQKIKPKPPALGEDIIETSSHELVAVVDSNKLKNKIEEIKASKDSTNKNALAKNEEDKPTGKNKKEVSNGEQEKKKVKQRNKSKSLVHKVKRGEVLGAIARKYETTVKKLIEWNNKNSEQIKPGEKIKIKNVDEELVKKINSEKSVRLSLTHKVKKGEVLLKIADKYGCSIRELKNWNGLNNSNIKVGQKLVIYKDLKHQEIEEKNNATSYHKVRPGDTLWDIAKKYKGVSVRDLRKLNENLNNESLKPGQKIKINDTG